MMHKLKFMLIVGILFNANAVLGQGIGAVLNGLRGISSGNPIEVNSCIEDTELTHIDSFEDLKKKHRNVFADWGEMVYNTKDYKRNNENIPQGLNIWTGVRWQPVYKEIPKGSFKGDLIALDNMQRKISNRNEIFWDIDFDNIDNPKNLNLNGVFFRMINGEYRVEELNFIAFPLKGDIIITEEGLEALAVITTSNSKQMKNLNIKLPNLVYLRLSKVLYLNDVILDCENLLGVEISDCNNYNPNHFNYQDTWISSGWFKELDMTNCSNLIMLNCAGNRMTDINISQCKKLKYLNINDNGLPTNKKGGITKLNLLNNVELVTFEAKVNNIEELDLKNNKNIKYINCSSNNLTELDTRHNPNLRTLDMGMNKIETLDLSRNNKLQTLICAEAYKLKSINLSNCSDLKYVNCYYTSSLENLDLSATQKLEFFNIDWSKLHAAGSITICECILQKIKEEGGTLKRFSITSDSDAIKTVKCD